MTIQKLLPIATKQLNSQLESEILLSFILNIDRIKLLAQNNRELKQNEIDQFELLIKRRQKHEPIAYLVGFQPFLELNIKVTPAVLIPRPETEEMVEKTIQMFKSEPANKFAVPKYIADIGTGSGAIAIALAKHLTRSKIIGIDTSNEALNIAKENSILNKVDSRCEFRLGDLLEPLNNQVDLIISNPPYIPTKDLATLDPDVLDFEPMLALDGGQDGLDHIRQLIEHGPKYSKRLILEFGFGQEEQISKLASKHYTKVEIIKDLQQKPRFLFASML